MPIKRVSYRVLEAIVIKVYLASFELEDRFPVAVDSLQNDSGLLGFSPRFKYHTVNIATVVQDCFEFSRLQRLIHPTRSLRQYGRVDLLARHSKLAYK